MSRLDGSKLLRTRALRASEIAIMKHRINAAFRPPWAIRARDVFSGASAADQDSPRRNDEKSSFVRIVSERRGIAID